MLDQAHELLFFLSSRLLLPHALLSRSSIAALFLFALHAVLAQDGTGSNKTGDDVVELLFKWFGRSVAPSLDGFFVSDTIVWPYRQLPTYDPWVILAAVAQRTERVRLGTMVTPLSRRRPWKVACEAVTVDHLSNGRLILGVGLGNCGDTAEPPDPSFTHFGEATDARTRAEMLDEALEVLVGLWSGEPFTHAGRYFQVREITLLPTPVQRPRIPIWVGGTWPKWGPVRRAARWDGFFPNRPDLTPDDIRNMKVIVDGGG